MLDSVSFLVMVVFIIWTQFTGAGVIPTSGFATATDTSNTCSPNPDWLFHPTVVTGQEDIIRLARGSAPLRSFRRCRLVPSLVMDL